MEEKEDLYKVIISTLIFFIALLIDNVTLKIILYFIAYIVVSYEIIINAVKNILKGEIVRLIFRKKNTNDDFSDKIELLQSKGFKAKEIAVILSELFGANKNDIYKKCIN